MDSFTYSSLQSEYDDFADPLAVIKVNDKDLRENKNGLTVTDIEVDLTCGFDAGQAAFSLMDCYDMIKTQFEYDKVKDYIILGSPVVIALGYNMKAREVFRGVIVRTEFVIDDMAPPHVRVTAMDVKAIMMANHYHKRLSAANYSGAIKEIFNQSAYSDLQGEDGVITSLKISSTPDAMDMDDMGETDTTIEMVGESDYEFIVRAAKRFNFEFYCIGGTVLFREARGDTTTLLELSNDTRVFNMNVAYDVTGLVGKVTVRGLDPGKAKVVESTLRHNLKISAKSSAKSLIKDSQYVYVDPTVTSKSDAQQRSFYLYDTMSYRFGSLDMEIMGLPEIIPGRFIQVSNYGTAASNQFYVTAVHHRLDSTGQYTSRIVGQAQKLLTDLSDLL